MASIDTITLPFFALILLGYGCGRLARLPEEGLAWLNVFVLYVAVPAMFFAVVSRTPIEEFANWPFAIATTLVTLCTFALAFCYAILTTRGDFAASTMAALSGAYSNGGYIGVPLMLAAFGPEASVPTTLVFVADSTLFFAIIPLLMALVGVEQVRVLDTASLVLRRVALHPFNLATALAIMAAAFRVTLPAPIDQTLDLLKNAAAPCALFALGVTVAARPLTGIPATMPGILAIKLLVHPALMLLVLGAIGSYPRIWVETAVLMASLPAALGTYILARQYDVWVREASNVLLVGTLLSIVTVSLLIQGFRMGLVPTAPFGP